MTGGAVAAARDAPRPHVLLVGADPVWVQAMREACMRLGATLDTSPTMTDAIARLLEPVRPYSHVAAQASLDRRSRDALAGLLDEVTLQPAGLLLLGGQDEADSESGLVPKPDVDAILRAMQGGPPDPAADTARTGSNLTPPQLAESLQGNMLRMRFQPIVGAVDLEPVGLETLARLHHPDRGILHPGTFISLAMGPGMERILSGVVAARTMLEMRGFICPDGMFVSLNLPLSAVMHADTVDWARRLCAIARTPRSSVVIEVLETHEAPDLRALGRALEGWHAAEFRTAIDDAGPALPHWRQMIDLPFDILKVDGAIAADPEQHALTGAIVQAARRRGLFVIAEGIKTDAIRRRMQALDVDALQGFLVGRPLPAMAVPVWLDQKRPGTLPLDPARETVVAA